MDSAGGKAKGNKYVIAAGGQRNSRKIDLGLAQNVRDKVERSKQERQGLLVCQAEIMNSTSADPQSIIDIDYPPGIAKK
jgi:hypothetical protein